MKSVLITGANRGIGYGLVKQFLASKADYIFAGYRQMDRSKVFSFHSQLNTDLYELFLQELFDLAQQNTASIVPLQLGSFNSF